jgi:hypothetical protein
MGLLDDYMAQVQDYKRAGSIGSGLLADRPNLELGKQGLLNQMQSAESEYLKRVSNPLPYYRQNPEAQGLLNVSPELDLLDLATGGGKMAMAGAIKKAAKIKGYHGSPHSFDNFDFSHMGSGEGAQAFGWGGYIGGLEDTAIGYRNALSQGNKVISIDGVRGAEPTAIENWVLSQGGDAKKAYDKLSTSAAAKEKSDKLSTSSKVDDLGMGFSEYDMALMDYNDFQSKLNEIKALEGKKLTLEPSGNMYEVEVDADMDNILDWDAPISQQSDFIKNAADKFIKKYTNEGDEPLVKAILGKDPTGESVYELPQFLPKSGSLLSSKLPKESSEYLNSIGVKGIKYFDGSSRNTDWQLSTPDTTVSGKWMVKDANQPNSKGLQYDNEIDAKDSLSQKGNTSNYVVFDEKIMNIVKKYGVSIPVATAMFYGNKDEPKGLLNQEYLGGKI